MGFEPGASEETVLIGRIKQGERSGFDNLVALYQQKGLGIAYNIVGNLEDAKDVLQEAFVKVYLNIKGFKEKSLFSTWFYRIIVNCSLDFLRKKKKISRMLAYPLADESGQEVELQIPDSRYEPDKAAISAELNDKIEDSIANLSEKQRLCFVLKHQSGLNNEEISQVIKCNPSTVKVHLFRAVNNLRKNLAKYNLKGRLGC